MIFFTFFVPKGELAEGTQNFLYKRFGLDIPLKEVGISTKRSYWVYPPYEIVVMRSWDIPLLTETRGGYGVTGKDVLIDWFRKYPSKLRVIEELKYGVGRISLIGRTPLRRLKDYKQPVRVSTPYSGLAEWFFKERNIDVVINPLPLTRLEGGFENLLLLGLTDIVIDFVGRRRTIEDNGLLFEEIEKILDTNAIFFQRVD